VEVVEEMVWGSHDRNIQLDEEGNIQEEPLSRDTTQVQ